MKTNLSPKVAGAPLTKVRVFAIACAVAVSVTVLAGCAANQVATTAPNDVAIKQDTGASATAKADGNTKNGTNNNSNSNTSTNTKTGAELSAFSSADIMFAQMMIPHHQQAVDMGTLAETRASSPVVRALAALIKSQQAPEISQMKSWLKTAGASTKMGHDMGMNGMLDAAAMTALRDSKGPAFDKLFLKGMIGHHLGAVDMAKRLVASKNPLVQTIAKTIIGSQTEQITFMQNLLKK